MKQKLRMFAIHQTVTSLPWTYNLNPRTKWYPALDESNRMKSACFTIHLNKNPPPQNRCKLKSRFNYSFNLMNELIKIKIWITNFTSSTFPIQPDFSQHQPVTITLTTGSPRTLEWGPLHTRDREPVTTSTSSTLIGGNGRAGPSSLLHTMLEGATEWVCECKMDVKSLHGFLRGMECVSSSLGLFSKTASRRCRPTTSPGDHGIPNAHNRWFILLYHVWGPAWMKIHWISNWLRARSHMASHYTRGSVTTRHDFGGVLEQPLDTSFWSLTIFRSRHLARVWSGPNKLH